MRASIGLALLTALSLMPSSLEAQTTSTSGSYSPGGSNYNAGGMMSNNGVGNNNSNNSTPSNFDNAAFQNRINTSVQRGQEFLRSNRNTNTTNANGSFVGADLGDLRDFLGMTRPNQARTRLKNSISGTTSTSRLGRGSSSLSRRSPGVTGLNSNTPQGAGNGQSSSNGDADVLRTSLRLGQDETSRSAAGSELAARLQKLSHHSGPNETLSVELAGGVATLRGTVGSEHERALCGQMLALEPGVSQVKNQLTVAPASQPSGQP